MTGVNAPPEMFDSKAPPSGSTLDETARQNEPFDDEVLARASASATRKLDWILLPILTAYYFLNFLDRSNFGNAKAAGLQEDLGLSNHQYSIALTVTYVPYIVAEFPITLTIKKFGPNYVLPALVASWGLVCCMQGFVHNYSGLLAARFFLGLAEGGVLPGLVTYMSMYWIRRKMQLRLSVVFTATSLAGAFSGLLASAILNIQSDSYASWAFIFFIEGGFTVAFGVLTLPFLPRSVSKCWWLNEEEKAAINWNLKQDGGGEAVDDAVGFSWDQVWTAFKSPHVMLLMIMFFMQGDLLYSLAYFAPSIVQGLGYDKIMTQLYSVPPYACAFGFSLMCAVVGDRYSCRGLTTLISFFISLAGYAIFYACDSHNPKYAGLFLQVIGAYTFAPATSTWMSVNSAPHVVKATAIATGFVATNSGGILSAWIYDTPPDYEKGTIVSLIFCCVGAALTVLTIFYLQRENKLKASRRVEMEKEEEEEGGLDDKGIVRLGDRSPYFVYSL